MTKRSSLITALMTQLGRPELWLVLLAAATRLVPHPPNFTAIGGLALLSGATLKRPWILALAVMILSDAIIGFHALVPFVYGAFLLTVFVGWRLRRQKGIPVWTAAAIAGSLLFFLITNFGVWISGGSYPRTSAGLVDCYAMAIPFYRNSLVGDLLFTGLLFGTLRVVDRFSKAALLARRPSRL